MTISKNTKDVVKAKISAFNKEKSCEYCARYRKAFLYLDLRDEFGQASPICRLTFTGDMDKWEFAIYKYSGNKYDPGERLFPGSEFLDGTLEGAMQAGLRAYT